MAVIFALKKFRVYLLSTTPFKVVTDHQALRFALQKKDMHGRLARWLDLMAEYESTIEYRPGNKNSFADYRSRITLPDVLQETVDEEELLCLLKLYVDDYEWEDELVQVSKYLMGLPIDGDRDDCRRTRRLAKMYLVWNSNIFRRRSSGLVVVPPISRRSAILKHYHDEVCHWDSKATKKLIMERFWSPNVYHEVSKYVSSCENCQGMAPVPSYNTSLKTPSTTLFDVFSIDFAGPLPTSRSRNKYMLVCVEHLTGWPIVESTASSTAAVVIDFVRKHILEPYGPPRVIVSDNATCFTATSLVAFMKNIGTRWKTVAAYAPMSNGRAERMVGTIKRSVGKMVYRERHTWDEKLPHALYGYRRRHLDSGLSPFQLLYGVVPRMKYQPDSGDLAEGATEEQRSFELMALSAHRASRVVEKNTPRRVLTEPKLFEVGDVVLVARGQSPASTAKWPAFTTKYYGPCLVVHARHPRYTLKSPHGRYSRSDIHARRLRLFHSK